LNILVVEDNVEVASVIAGVFEAQGFAVDVANEGCEGEEMAVCATRESRTYGAGKYDVIVLDVQLPDCSGVDVCRNIRRRGVRSGVLMITGLGSMADRIRGLEAGADDYMTKPFDLEEMLARVRALGRRGTASDQRWLRCDNLELDLYSRVAKLDGRTINLQQKEFALLEYLMRNPDRVLATSMIGRNAWGSKIPVGSNLVAVYIGCLRKRLSNGHARQFIQTFRGVGYRFDASGHSECDRPLTDNDLAPARRSGEAVRALSRVSR
jgi:DNA-binding response OmpR family regulator